VKRFVLETEITIVNVTERLKKDETNFVYVFRNLTLTKHGILITYDINVKYIYASNKLAKCFRSNMS